MKLLLDTCALIALSEGSLPSAAAAALVSAERAFISPIVPWELGIKVKARKLTLANPPLEWILNLAGRHQLDPPDAGLDAALLCAATDLPLIHRDPFDRVLVATAQRDGLTILTSDRLIPKYPDIVTIW